LLESVPAELNRLLNEKGGCLLEPDRNPLVGSVWMRDLTEHFERRNALETILRYIPGFHGYLEKEYRRDADALQRQWLADQLQQAKRPLDDLGRTWLERGQLDQLGQIDLLRSRLDQLIGRIRGAMRGYSGFSIWFGSIRTCWTGCMRRPGRQTPAIRQNRRVSRFGTITL
jgi:hypothetical protein